MTPAPAPVSALAPQASTAEQGQVVKPLSMAQPGPLSAAPAPLVDSHCHIVFRNFDADAYMVNFTARFLATRGGEVSQESGCDCAFIEREPWQVRGRPSWPGIERGGGCPADDTTYGKQWEVVGGSTPIADAVAAA